VSNDFGIGGADQFLAVSKILKRTGHKEMRKELHQGLQRAAKPLIRIDRDAAERLLPKRGGLNVRMAKAPQRVRVKTGDDAGISLELPGKQPGYNDGVIRHPVFERDKAHRHVRSAFGSVAGQATWVEQRIDGTWFDDTLRAAAPTVRLALDEAVNSVVRKIINQAKRG
jgi:hypothetical protein